MKFQKQKFLTLVLVTALTLSLAACDGTYEPGEGMTTHIDTNYEGPSASDYVNEGIADAKENGLYHETDYSSIQANGSEQNKNDDAEIGESAANPSQEPSDAGSNAENAGQASENPGQTDSGMGQETGNSGQSANKDNQNSGVSSKDEEFTREDLLIYLADQEYDEKPFIYVWDNEPDFTDEDLERTSAFESYSELDELGRVGVAFASLDESLAPKTGEKRGDISFIKPSGWKQAKYDGIDNGGWLYNRCHLIAWSLAGENANERNLMTGTRYFNTEGMLPFETQVLRYIDKNSENHVLYRATPVYDGDDLLAEGLLLEAWSIEDNGELHFCVYIFNVQPGIAICYGNGDSRKIE